MLRKHLTFILLLTLPYLSFTQIQINGYLSFKEMQQDHILYTRNGNRLTGKLHSISQDTISFLLKNNSLLQFPASDILTITSLAEEPEFVHEPAGAPAEKALWISPIGFRYEKGEGEVKSVGPTAQTSVSYGLTDNVTIAAGTFLYVPFIQAKVGYDLGEYVHVSAGCMLYPDIGYNDVLHVQGAISIGTKDYFVNMSGTKSSDILGGSNDLGSFGFGASIRTGKKSRVFFEYDFVRESAIYFWGEPNQLRLYTIGASWFTWRHRVDLGLMGVVEQNLRFPEGGFFGEPEPVYSYLYPAFAYSWRFGKNAQARVKAKSKNQFLEK